MNDKRGSARSPKSTNAYRWMAYAWDHSALEGKELLAHLAMASFAHSETGLLRAAEASIGSKARVDTRTVRRARAKLMESGEIELLKPGGPGRPSHYRMIEIPGIGALATQDTQVTTEDTEVATEDAGVHQSLNVSLHRSLKDVRSLANASDETRGVVDSSDLAEGSARPDGEGVDASERLRAVLIEIFGNGRTPSGPMRNDFDAIVEEAIARRVPEDEFRRSATAYRSKHDSARADYWWQNSKASLFAKAERLNAFAAEGLRNRMHSWPSCAHSEDPENPCMDAVCVDHRAAVELEDLKAA
jgi:hypothetical protein